MGSLFRSRPSTPPKSATQIKAEKRQERDMDRLDHQEKSRKAARKRKRRGRGSLISDDNDERGVWKSGAGTARKVKS